MNTYRIFENGHADTECYWVRAESDNEARAVVARHVFDAPMACNPSLFHCRIDDARIPPDGMIYRRLNGPIVIGLLMSNAGRPSL